MSPASTSGLESVTQSKNDGRSDSAEVTLRQLSLADFQKKKKKKKKELCFELHFFFVNKRILLLVIVYNFKFRLLRVGGGGGRNFLWWRKIPAPSTNNDTKQRDWMENATLCEPLQLAVNNLTVCWSFTNTYSMSLPVPKHLPTPLLKYIPQGYCKWETNHIDSNSLLCSYCRIYWL